MVKLACWNVNSLKVRLPQVLDWLKSEEVDILALQETKLLNEHFPAEVFENLGYHVAFSGQKTYNGVAVLSRLPLTEAVTDIPQLLDPQRRILGVCIGKLRLVNIYVPNGSELDSEKYQYKLDWLEKVTAYIQSELEKFPYLAVVGDFNIAPSDKDVHAPEEWVNSVLASPAERQAFSKLLDLGLYDSFRTLHPEIQAFSWWDYRAASFRRNRGLRIDHILLSSELQARCQQSHIDRAPRSYERPSDHAPIWVSLDLTP